MYLFWISFRDSRAVFAIFMPASQKVLTISICINFVLMGTGSFYTFESQKMYLLYSILYNRLSLKINSLVLSRTVMVCLGM